jgi:hypothetical protein
MNQSNSSFHLLIPIKFYDKILRFYSFHVNKNMEQSVSTESENVSACKEVASSCRRRWFIAVFIKVLPALHSRPILIAYVGLNRKLRNKYV